MANDNNGSSTAFDEDYFSSITGLEPDAGNQGQDDGQQQTSDEQSTQQTQQVEDQTSQTADKQPPQQQDKGQGEQQQQTGQADRQELRRHPSGQFVDRAGNIVSQDGQIIASAGKQRREYDQNWRNGNDTQTLRTRVQELEQNQRSIEFLNNVPRQLGLTNDETAQGLDYAARLKRGDYLGVARDFVAIAASKGVNISDILGKDAGDAIDLRAVRAMVDEIRQPQVEQQRQAQIESEATRQATDNYNRFINDNEFADVHGDVIVAYAKTNGVSLQAAYNHTRDFILSNGLDLSQPLEPQIQALQQSYQQQQQQPPASTHVRPMPNGVATGNAPVQEQRPAQADPDDDWGTIIRRAQAAG